MTNAENGFRVGFAGFAPLATLVLTAPGSSLPKVAEC